MNRRSFFRLLPAVPMAAAVAIAPRLAAPEVALAPASLPEALWPPRVIQSEIVHAALRLLGVLAPGEVAARDAEEAALLHLRGLLQERRWPSESRLAYALAYRLSPEYFTFGDPRRRFA